MVYPESNSGTNVLIGSSAVEILILLLGVGGVLVKSMGLISWLSELQRFVMKI